METIEGEFAIISENVLVVEVRLFGFFILDLVKDKINNFNEYCRWQNLAIVTEDDWEKITSKKQKYSLDAKERSYAGNEI